MYAVHNKMFKTFCLQCRPVKASANKPTQACCSTKKSRQTETTTCINSAALLYVKHCNSKPQRHLHCTAFQIKSTEFPMVLHHWSSGMP